MPLRHTLPKSMVRQIGEGVYQYRLMIQKQPGVPVESVSIFVHLPEGAKLARASRSLTGQVEQWVRLDFPLERDETVVVDFRLP